MKILVTGGAGFIGSHFVERMLKNDEVQSLVVLDSMTYAASRKATQVADSRYSFVEGNICDFDLVSRLVSTSDYVVNFAAESHVDRSIHDSSEFIKTNIVGTHNLLRASLEFKIRKYVQISTDEVYGSIEVGSWAEDAPVLPNSPYSASKASADLLVRSFHQTYGLNINITRCSNNYGPRQFPEKVIPVFINKIFRDENIPLYGKGNNIRDWLHVEDHCEGISLVLENGKPGEIYNIGGGLELDNKTLAVKILEEFGKTESAISYVEDRKGHDFRYSVDWTKIQSELGYQPKHKFEEGLESTIDWYRGNSDWWSE